MTCKCCGAEMEEEAKFCEMCGSPVVRQQTCSSCGCVNRDVARFCKNCGAALKGAESSAKPAEVPIKTDRAECPPNIWNSLKILMLAEDGCEASPESDDLNTVGFDEAEEMARKGNPWGYLCKGLWQIYEYGNTPINGNESARECKRMALLEKRHSEGCDLVHKAALLGCAPAEYIWSRLIARKIVSDNQISSAQWEKKALSQHCSQLEEWLLWKRDLVGLVEATKDDADKSTKGTTGTKPHPSSYFA